MSFNAKGLTVSQKSGEITIEKEGSVPKFVEHVNSISFSSKRAIRKWAEGFVCDRAMCI